MLTPGKRIYIDDGLISVLAEEIGEDFVIGKIENGGNLGSRCDDIKNFYLFISMSFL